MSGALQSIIDSGAGQVVATSLHTLGAIGLTGGLIAFVAWRRDLLAGNHRPQALTAATGLAYLGILANLLGGFMRTYQEGHPGLSQIGESAWVRVMLLKHLYIILAIAAEVYLFERIARGLVRAHHLRAAGKPAPPVPAIGYQTAVTLAGLGILVAAILGAVSQVTPLRPADESMDGEVDGMPYADSGAAATDVPSNETTLELLEVRDSALEAQDGLRDGDQVSRFAEIQPGVARDVGVGERRDG